MSLRKDLLKPNPSVQKTLFFVYAALVVAGMVFVLFLFREALNSSTIELLFLIPVLISTTFWGLGAGILAAILTFLCYNFFFLPPYYTFAVHKSEDILALVIFLIVAVLISQLVGRAKTGLQAALAREQESTQLYELSIGLAGVNDLRGIAAVIAQKTAETFWADAVQVSVERVQGENAFNYDEGNRAAIKADRPVMVVPLETMRGFLGEIRVWREQKYHSPAEERLLYTFAAQGALALERAALEHAETRAKVLEESDRLKSALLSSVSHEFRTPLVTIRAATTSLLSQQVDWDSEARKELLMAVDEEADHLNYLVGNLLNMSKIEAGVMKPNRQWNVLAEIVDAVLDRMHRILRHHVLRVDIPEDLPLVPVDYSLIEQVFANLLSNSAKYAPEGSEILVTASAVEGKLVQVGIANQGPKVAPEHLGRIFEKFYRITDAERVTGTGLGLSICKGIVEAHGGRIWAENLADGLIFKFTIPLEYEGMRPPLIEADGD